MKDKLFGYLKKNPIVEYAFFFILALIVSLVFADKTGLLECGYHLADDHEIIDMDAYINQNGLLSALKHYVLGDLVWRFRPVSFFLRVILVAIFKTNFVAWHTYRAIGIGIIVSLSYILARKLKTPIVLSILFSFMYLIGTQDEIIWRLGTQENLGIFFLALSMILVYDYYDKKKRVYGVLSAISIILMIMSKESFLLMAPAMIIFFFYLYLSDKEENEFDNIFIQLWDFIKEHKWFIITICGFLLLSSADILLYTGLNESGYAGIDTSYTLGEYIRLTLNVFIRDLKDYWISLGIAFVLLVCAIVVKVVKKNISRQYLRTCFMGLVFAGYSLVLQAIIYGTSSMFTRYYLPSVWVLYFIIVVLENKAINKYAHIVVVVALVVIANINLEHKEQSVLMDAEYFAKDGEHTTEMLDYVGSLKDKYQDMTVLTEFIWYEHNYSSSVYLQNEEGIDKVYFLDEEKENGHYKKIYQDNGERVGIEDADVILTNDPDNYNLDDYNETHFSNVYVLEKK